MKKPVIPPSPDGIYPRCVYDTTDIYGPAVIDYSKGEAVPSCCNNPLPPEYVKLTLNRNTK